MDAARYHRDDLKTLAFQLLARGGMEQSKADIVAELLVRTDEIGVTTHGISMIPYYLPELAAGRMASEGSFEVIRDTGATLVWDGGYLPGHWLMTQALDICMERATTHGIAALAIRRSHHIGCLSVFTRIAAEKGLVCYIATSDPSGAWVAPYGGAEPTFTPNPWAIGYPAQGHPVLIDTCASITTVSKVRAHINDGIRFSHPWMLDAEGNATTDPNVVNADPRGTIQLTGGTDHGHKGYGIALMVEMLTQALAGHGRAQHPDRWGGNVYLQVMAPDAFAGAEPFVEETTYLGELCRNNRPADGGPPVRVPGDRVQSALADAAENGIQHPDEVWRRVSASAADLGVDLPSPIPERTATQ
ncbi:Ldh family oxidoreductase [Tropicimonas sp. IMCC6043]|uniref:Ldh family oxidoreductase n=1 Tax=Tropicimonas sp. IMCC6043 TaxID=2510645 RepID=UPI00101C315A|nr:Ldh family oxidoreductase [Tropicimonas sp. IMCC6043]RYH11721.1 Ldh family oxidoreductase [Tropicimonas sp. IMCC6043]